MRTSEKYRIDIFKLSNETHEYDFDIDNDFFDLFEFSSCENRGENGWLVRSTFGRRGASMDRLGHCPRRTVFEDGKAIKNSAVRGFSKF